MTFNNMFFFLIISISFYSLLNYYVYSRIKKIGLSNKFQKLLFLILVISVPFGFAGIKLTNLFLFKGIAYIGVYYLGALVYLFLFSLLLDLLFLINRFTNIVPTFVKNSQLFIKKITFISLIFVVTIILVYGYFNSLNVKISEYNLILPKRDSKLENLNLVVFSDLHLNRITNVDFVQNIINSVNKLKPDLILIPGDIIDNGIKEIKSYNFQNDLKQLEATFGVFATTGNHEYFSDLDKTIDYIEGADIKLLRDSLVEIDSMFYIIGRNDIASQRFNFKRKGIPEILIEKNKNLPIFLMSHTPLNLDETIDNKIDIQLSGHTHHGQLFPINFITNLIYRLSWGYKQFGNSHFFVTCGVGTWGPPIRTSGVSEIMHIQIKFE